MTDGVVHLIRWHGDDAKWIAEVGSLDSEDLKTLLWLYKDTTISGNSEVITTVQVAFELQNWRTVNYCIVIPGLNISRRNPDRKYRVSDFEFSIRREDIDIDPNIDIWADERHDAEIERDTRWEKESTIINRIARRLILFGGNVFLVSESLSEGSQEERVFLLVEDAVNKERLELDRLRRRVKWQRRVLGLDSRGPRFERRDIPDELIKIIVDRDRVCCGCGSDEDLQLDHIIPVSRGGNESEDNLRLLCGSCNRKRGNLENF
jgi:hypothetical protein